MARMNLKTILVLLVLVGAGVYAYMHFTQGKSPVSAEVDPYAAAAAFTTGMYSRALQGYQDILSQKIENDQTPEVMYRIGVCLVKLDRGSEALRAFEAYVARYPGHTSANTAREHMDKLRLEGVK